MGRDITYIPMAGGFLYLVAIMDSYSRYVLAWRLSNSLGLGMWWIDGSGLFRSTDGGNTWQNLLGEELTKSQS